ncbi:uncharacterized protein GGS22DRAFT_192707 [Annulohypoxylon maeteangense]|uniref:uncharacterized protein n=1 Tax=Annulohypoxylon maeteangense TaxID=1927788 RepID=UPI0020083625|nr:uncharacterized protein GGS22DRAFT_192707 [Annulohypoxylon maeteangense]KAI0880872.1 hypothetical protein GGS22DRAFT_192707 [Annulohypoxylon maeteangense]
MAQTKVSASRLILRALSQWPKDTLRPQIQLQDVLRKRFEQSELPDHEQVKQANALYSLMHDRYKNKYPINGSLLNPKSHPNYFTDLVKELEEAPSRSYFERLWLRLKGVVRLQ